MDLKAQMKFGENLSEAIKEIKREYSEYMKEGEDVDNNEYIRELIKLKAMELDIPDKVLKHLFKNMIIGKTSKTEIEKIKRYDVNLIAESIP